MCRDQFGEFVCRYWGLKELCHIICYLKKAKTSCPGIQLVSKIMV